MSKHKKFIRSEKYYSDDDNYDKIKKFKKIEKSKNLHNYN